MKKKTYLSTRNIADNFSAVNYNWRIMRRLQCAFATRTRKVVTNIMTKMKYILSGKS